MKYAKPRPVDPRRPEGAEEILAEDLNEALGEDSDEDEEDDPVVLGFFDEAWPQPVENSQRMWSFDRTETIENPLVTFPWRPIGFLRTDWPERDHVQTAVSEGDDRGGARRDPRAKSAGPDSTRAENYSSHHAQLTQERADELGIEFVFLPPYSPTLNASEPLWKDLK